MTHGIPQPGAVALALNQVMPLLNGLTIEQAQDVLSEAQYLINSRVNALIRTSLVLPVVAAAQPVAKTDCLARLTQLAGVEVAAVFQGEFGGMACYVPASRLQQKLSIP